MDMNLLVQLEKVHKIAGCSRLGRLFNNPFKYINAIFFRQIIYPINHSTKIVEAKLFYGKKMKIALPASTDIYLTGGKSHDSEIRLAKFLILNLQSGNHYLDIGAHYGYFVMLASEIVSDNGKVMAFEPSSFTYRLLSANTKSLLNTKTFQKAVSNSQKNLTFYEFPNLHSEYNSSDVSQFETESWFKKAKPKKLTVAATTLDVLTSDLTFCPDIIKIDVEGAENLVIDGGANYLRNHSPNIVMEYLAPNRHNASHQMAADMLAKLGYICHLIDPNGKLIALANINEYMISNGLESDNLVFSKISQPH